MEKAIYALWAREGEDRGALNARIKSTAAPALLDRAEVRGLRLNLQDEAVAGAEARRLRCAGTAQPDAVVQLWLDAAHDAFRAAVDTILIGVADRIAAWSVASSTIIRNRDHPAQVDGRTPGWSQLCFLVRPKHLDHATWRHYWQDLHTRVAIDTQSNFEYVQNLIVRPLIAGPQDYAAIVEECFPEAAMCDARVFFDAVDDDRRFDANVAAMTQSCVRFICEGGLDLLPTSQFDLRLPS